MSSNVTITVDDDEPPKRLPPPPPKRLSRPKITLSIPDQTARGPITAQIPMTARGQAGLYWDPRLHGKAPVTPGSHVSDPQYFNPFVQMYHNKASDFMFKQFAGFKDFTIHTAKSGLSVGEKSAFWFYNKLRTWSKKWFTHFFLSLCLVLYSVMGAAIFMAIEGSQEENLQKNATVKNITDIRREMALRIKSVTKEPLSFSTLEKIEEMLIQYESDYTTWESSRGDHKKVWGFWNSMFYAGTIYTTIDSEVLNDTIEKYK